MADHRTMSAGHDDAAPATVAPVAPRQHSAVPASVVLFVPALLAAVILFLVTPHGGGNGDVQLTGTVNVTVVPSEPVATAPANSAVQPTSTPPTSVGVTTVPIAAPPTTGRPTTIATVSAGAALSSTEATNIIRSYYAAVQARDYETAWSQLTPEFQQGRARSFEAYVEFWDDNDVEVGWVQLERADAREATVRVDFRWNGADSWQTDRFTLRSEGARWLIASQTTIIA